MKNILFLPSNKNHVLMFCSINEFLSNYNTIFLTQGSYKDEGTEDALNEFNLRFSRFENYKEPNPDFILRYEKINLIILGNDIDVIPQWFVNSSNALGIPSVLIQDGMLFDYATKGQRFSKIPIMLTNSRKLIKLALKLKIKKKFKKISYGESNCTQIHVWGKYAKKYLEDKQIDPDKIIITGNPNFKTTTFPKSKNKTKQILYCPTSLIETGILDKKTVTKIVKTICKVTSQIKEITLIIKPHPIEKKIFYQRLIRTFHQKIKLTEKSVIELLKTSDCLITNLSTVSMDALSSSTPVLLYLPNMTKIVKNDSFPQLLIDAKVALYAYDEESLRNQLTKILQDDFDINENNRKQILEDFYGPLDSNAAVRSSQEIKTLLD